MWENHIIFNKYQSGLDVMYTVMFKKGTAFHYAYASPEKVKLT